MSFNRPHRLRLLSVLLLSSMASMPAATKTWDGGAGTTSWNDANNWNTNGVPVIADDITFSGTLPASIGLNADQLANSLTFNTTSTFSLVNGSGSRTLDLATGNITRSAGSSGTQTLAFANLHLRANATFAIDGSGLLAISSVIRDDGGARSINRTGSGTLLLNGSNSFSGGLTLAAGTTLLGSNTAAGTGTLTFGGGTLSASGARTIGNAVSATSTTTVGGSDNLEFTGAFSLVGGDRTLQIDNTGTTKISGALSNSWYSTTTKSGAGTLILSGNNSSLVGPLSVAQGTLQLESGAALGSANYGNSVSSGATLALAGGITINENAFDIAGSGASGNGAIRNVSGSNTLSGILNLKVGSPGTELEFAL